MTQSYIIQMLPRTHAKVKVFSCLCLVVMIFWTYDQYLQCRTSTGPRDIRTAGYRAPHNLEASSVRSSEHNKKPYITPWKEFVVRTDRAENVCKKETVPGRVHGVYNHTAGVLYCFVPKAGCTFWKRVFKALLSEISRNLVHSPNESAMSFSPELHNRDRFPVRFLVTRDPFSRLLSAYLDKFYLIDFWPSESKPMISNRAPLNTLIGSDFLRAHFEKLASRFDEQSNRSSTQNETRCGKYVTFFEFVRDGFNRSEPHWMPIHEICNPCLFNVTHVLHMESFTEDSRAILAKMDMERLLVDSDHNKQVDEEIQTIIDYNFNKTHETQLASFFEQCVTPTELAFRLWNNFRWRGYIDPDIDYVIPDYTSESRIKEDLTAQITRARKSGLSNPDRMKQAKNKFKESAFQTIPKDLFIKLTKKYSLDFKLFGYEDVRDKLFNSLFRL